MFYIQRGSDDEDPTTQVQDDDEEVLDFVFDGTVRYASTYASEGRSHITALRDLVEAALGGHADVPAIAAALNGLVTRVDQAITHFRKCAERTEVAEFSARSIAAYGGARDALTYLQQWVDDPRKEYLSQGMLALERAVADVDELVAEEEGKA